jgi:hypothetical protein
MSQATAGKFERRDIGMLQDTTKSMREVWIRQTEDDRVGQQYRGQVAVNTEASGKEIADNHRSLPTRSHMDKNTRAVIQVVTVA